MWEEERRARNKEENNETEILMCIQLAVTFWSIWKHSKQFFFSVFFFSFSFRLHFWNKFSRNKSFVTTIQSIAVEKRRRRTDKNRRESMSRCLHHSFNLRKWILRRSFFGSIDQIDHFLLFIPKMTFFCSFFHAEDAYVITGITFLAFFTFSDKKWTTINDRCFETSYGAGEWFILLFF